MKKILVVDDVKLICTLCQDVLTKSGFEVVTQPSGARCIAYLKSRGRSAADLLILDVEMPYMSGFETLESIRTMEAFSDLPVFFLTSSCTRETVSKAIRLGAKDYIKKPFDSEDLLRRVNKILYPEGIPAETEEAPAPAGETEAGEAAAPEESAAAGENSGTEETAETESSDTAEGSADAETPAPDSEEE